MQERDPIDELYRSAKSRGNCLMGRIAGARDRAAIHGDAGTLYSHDAAARLCVGSAETDAHGCFLRAQSSRFRSRQIHDIYNGRGVEEFVTTKGNVDGMEKMTARLASGKSGLIFCNLVDFDMLYGHRKTLRDLLNGGRI